MDFEVVGSRIEAIDLCKYCKSSLYWEKCLKYDPFGVECNQNGGFDCGIAWEKARKEPGLVRKLIIGVFRK